MSDASPSTHVSAPGPLHSRALAACPTLTEPARQTPVLGPWEVLVLGGGPAGIAAASAAARLGARTLLVEGYGFLGGMGTAAGVTNFCGLHANVRGTLRRVVRGVADRLLDRLQALGGLNTPHPLFGGRIAAQAYDNAAFKLAADAELLAAGAQVLFHARAVGATRQPDGALDALLLETRSGRVAVRAAQFIDCSGDGDLAAWAGVPFEKGADGRSMMYPSTMFRIGGVDPQRAGRAWETIPQHMAEAAAEGQRFARQGPIIRPQRNPTEWRANVTQLANPDGSPVDGTEAWQLSAAELQGRQQIAEFMGFLQQRVPGFEAAYLLEIAPQVGIRETRRISGRHVLTEEEVLGAARFDDSIGVNGWMVEEHVAGNVSFRWPADIGTGPGYNQLPWRMLLPAAGPHNLLVAGRCASMTHGGQSAARVSGACFVMGQAAGTGAALALRAGCAPGELAVSALQAQLQADGAWLGGEGEAAQPAL